MADKPKTEEKFEDAISTLRDAEERSVRELEKAKSAKEERIKKAREKADAIVAKSAEEATALKERVLAEARARIEKEERAIIADGGRQAAEIRKIKLPEGLPAKICQMLLEEFNV